MYFVYVLESKINGRLYVGSTSDLERRLKEHNAGKTISTRPFIPYDIIYQEEYQTLVEARQRERQIKRSGKLRKEIKLRIYMAPSSSG